MRASHSAWIGLSLGALVAFAAARNARSYGDSTLDSATAPVDSSRRPAIDRRVPAKLETATFALG